MGRTGFVMNDISVFVGRAVARGLWSCVDAAAPALKLPKIVETLAHRRRLRRYAVAENAPNDIARLRLRRRCQDPRCACHIAARWDGLAGFAREDRLGWLLNPVRPVATMIALDDYASFADYVRAVSRISGGNDRREATRARKRGYVTRIIGPNSHPVSLAEIIRSKPVRSGGVIRAAQQPKSAAGSQDDVATDFARPACREHWQIDFGVFNQADPGRMMAKATLGRSGDLIEIVFLMGHGDALRDGVMKLLMFDMMEWLLDSGDELVRGAAFLNYGAVEEGRAGREKWRRYLGFRPFRLDIPAPAERNWRPLGWDPAAYLALNPDLRAARVLPLTHFRLKGVFEGRAFAFKPARAAATEAAAVCFDELESLPAAE